MLISSTSFSHDPSEHMKTNEKPNCAGIDRSKMNMDDPVAQAMMKQCSTGSSNMKHESNHDLHSGMHEKHTMGMKHHKHDELKN
jgi:hypothetical protein